MNKYAPIVVVALIVGGILGYVWRENINSPKNRTQSQAAAQTTQITQKQVDLRQNMRVLWTDHVVWTRDYIIASVDSKPDAQAAANRLLKNQEDIGNAISSYYGKDAGDKLTELLKQHILIAVDLINAAKTNNQTAFNDVNTRWSQNGQEIADFLSSANPDNWPQDIMREMMKKHLSTTTDEVSARVKKDYEADVKAYDAVYQHILTMVRHAL